LQSCRRRLILALAPYRRRPEGGAHAQHSIHCFADLLSGVTRHGVRNARRPRGATVAKGLQRTDRAHGSRMWSPQTSRVRRQLPVKPLLTQTGIHRLAPMDPRLRSQRNVPTLSRARHAKARGRQVRAKSENRSCPMIWPLAQTPRLWPFVSQNLSRDMARLAKRGELR
jgi:hypothetical protein